MAKSIRGKIITAIASKREYQRLVPRSAIQVLQDVMEQGEKNGKHNWQSTPVDEHLERVFRHITLYRMGVRSEYHIRCAFCRLMMAVVCNEKSEVES